MSSVFNWAKTVAADPRISAVTARVAMGLAGMANDSLRIRSKMTTLSEVCHVASRRMGEHLMRLIELGYLQQQDMSRQGRFAVTIVPADQEAANAPEKSFRELSGTVVGVKASGGSVTIYVDGATQMLKVTMDRASASKISGATLSG